MRGMHRGHWEALLDKAVLSQSKFNGKTYACATQVDADVDEAEVPEAVDETLLATTGQAEQATIARAAKERIF